jgi:hypothetical protein
MNKNIKAGALLNDYIDEYEPAFKVTINSFIEKFSVKRKELNELLCDSRHKPFIFQLVRKYYVNLVDEKYKGLLPDYPINLLKNYIVSMTK